MTLKQFQNKVAKVNWHDKYYYYLLYLSVTGLGIFLFYDLTASRVKYEKYGTHYLGYFASAFLTIVGIRGLFLVPNRYKILSVNSPATLDRKKEIIQELVQELGSSYRAKSETFYSFMYKKNWWASEYIVYLGIDSDVFYVSVQSRTAGYHGGGIIDFGGAEKARQKIINYLTGIIGRQ